MSEQNPQPPPPSASLGHDLPPPLPLLAAVPLSRLAAALAGLERQELGLPWARLHDALRHGRSTAARRALAQRGAARGRMVATRKRGLK